MNHADNDASGNNHTSTADNEDADQTHVSVDISTSMISPHSTSNAALIMLRVSVCVRGCMCMNACVCVRVCVCVTG